MSARLDQACSWCPVQAWCCSSLLSRVPVPIPCQQPDFGLAPVATHDWSPAAAEVSHSPLVHHKHVHEERTTSHARVGASEAVTASPAVREPAKQQRRRPVLDRGQAGEGSRVVCPTPSSFLHVTAADMSTAKEPVDKWSLGASDASRKSAFSTVTRRKRARTDHAQ